MATSQRIYLVTTNDGKERLVKATQRQQALSHVANSLFTVKVASQDDLVKADRKSTRLNSSHIPLSRMPSSA